MKKVLAFPIAAFILLASSLNAQTIKSYVLSPAAPTDNSDISLFLETEFGSGSCSLANYDVAVDGSNINVVAYYLTGAALYICNRTDEIHVGSFLACGNYTLNINTYVIGTGLSDSKSVSLNVTCVPCINVAPGNAQISSVDSRSAMAIWSTTPKAAGGYEVLWREQGGNGHWSSKDIRNSDIGSLEIRPLKAGRTYEWQMRSQCSSHPNTFSPYTAIQTFTTPAARLGQEDILADDFYIFPNPLDQGTDQLHITLNEESQGVTVQIFNVLGEKAASFVETVTSGTATIDCSSLTRGVYFVQVDAGSQHFIQRLVIQ